MYVCQYGKWKQIDTLPICYPVNLPTLLGESRGRKSPSAAQAYWVVRLTWSGRQGGSIEASIACYDIVLRMRMNIFHIKANTSLNLQMLYIASAQLRHLYITKTAHKLGNKHKTVFARVSCLIKIIYKITCTQIFIDIYIYIYIYNCSVNILITLVKIMY